jgi:hypothetical protein
VGLRDGDKNQDIKTRVRTLTDKAIIMSGWLQEEFEMFQTCINDVDGEGDCGSSTWMVSSKIAHWGGRVINRLKTISEEERNGMVLTREELDFVSEVKRYLIEQRDAGKMVAMDVPFYKRPNDFLMSL